MLGGCWPLASEELEVRNPENSNRGGGPEQGESLKLKPHSISIQGSAVGIGPPGEAKAVTMFHNLPMEPE